MRGYYASRNARLLEWKRSHYERDKFTTLMHRLQEELWRGAKKGANLEMQRMRERGRSSTGSNDVFLHSYGCGAEMSGRCQWRYHS